MSVFMQKKATERGFEYYEFNDLYSSKCSLQESSLAEQDAVWLGIDDPDPKIMNSDARRLGYPSSGDNGWTEFNIPKQVVLHTRMHLSREQARDLGEKLIMFAQSGEL